MSKVDKSLELYKQLLQLPQRTIETLEVGDLVHFGENKWMSITLIKENGIVYFTNFRCHREKLKDKAVIPREALELLKEVMK